jgi:acyl carrier protein
MKEKIIEIITRTLGLNIGTITENTAISEVENWDSLMQLMILSELNDQLGIKIPIEDALEIKSVAEFIKFADKE